MSVPCIIHPACSLSFTQFDLDRLDNSFPSKLLSVAESRPKSLARLRREEFESPVDPSSVGEGEGAALAGLEEAGASLAAGTGGSSLEGSESESAVRSLDGAANGAARAEVESPPALVSPC